MSFTRSSFSPKPSPFLRAAALVVAAGCWGAVACSDEAPVNPPQGTANAGTAGTTADNGLSGTDNNGSGKGGSANTPEGGSGDGGDGAMPTAGTAGSPHGGAGGMSGSTGNGGNGGVAGNSGASGASGGGQGGASAGSGNAGAGAGNGGSAGIAGNGGHAGKGGGGAGGTTAGTGGTSAGTDAGGSAGTAGTGNTGTCGDVTVDSGEECEAPGTAICSNDCQSVATQACADCEATQNCSAFATSCLTSPGVKNTEDQAKCFDVQECVYDTGCAKGEKTLTSCFCGDLSTNDCGAAAETGPSAPKGPCAQQIKAASGAGATNTQVLSRLLQRNNYPSGAALYRFNCLKANDTCKATCGFE